MYRIEKCNPNAQILQHIGISINRLRRQAKNYIGLILPSGKCLDSICDVLDFCAKSKDDEETRLVFGGRHCHHKDITGKCLGHKTDGAEPCDFKITSLVTNSHDFYKDICYDNFRYYPIHGGALNNAKVGDFITLKRADFDESIKLVITCTRCIYDFSSYLGVWPVMQHEANGMIHYFI